LSSGATPRAELLLSASIIISTRYSTASFFLSYSFSRRNRHHADCCSLCVCCFVVDSHLFLPQPDKQGWKSHVRGHPPSCGESSNVFDSAHRIGKMWSPCLFHDGLCLLQIDRKIDRGADVVLCGFMSYGTLHRCENLKFCTVRIVLHILFTLVSACCRNQSHLNIPHHSQERFVLLLTMGVPDHAALPHRKPYSGGRSRDICGAQRRPKWSSCMYTYTVGFFI